MKNFLGISWRDRENKGKGLFDARRGVTRMRAMAGSSHLAFQSTAASGRQCTTARRQRNSLSVARVPVTSR